MQAAHLTGNYVSSPFDTLKFAKRAEKVGFTKEQAEFQAEEIAKVIDDHIATKNDFREIRKEVKSVFSILEAKLETLENRLIIKVGSMLVIAIGVLTTILKLM
jgi:hypothetical protein